MKLHRFILLTVISTTLVTTLGATDFSKKGPSSFEDYDMDKNGLISEVEFYDLRAKKMESKAQQGMRMKNATNAPSFEYFDTNNDKQISKIELLEGQMKNMSEKKSQKGMKKQGQGMGQGMGKSN